jgi:hypothetical protein
MMHREVVGQALCAELLKQEADVPEMKVSDASALRGHDEAKVMIEPFGSLEVLGRDERF